MWTVAELSPFHAQRLSRKRSSTDIVVAVRALLVVRLWVWPRLRMFASPATAG